MTEFRALAVVKHPREMVWTAMRDRLPELVAYLPNVESVVVESRHEQPDGMVTLVNVWQASAQVPAMFQGVITADMLSWTDRAEWWAEQWECRWRIRAHAAQAAVCTGVTRYEPAMGERGTKITLQGQMSFAPGIASVSEGLLAGAAPRGVESFVSSLVPSNFQKLAKAAGAYLLQ